ncbi:MAG: nitroreductase/quinone reductase family protein [Candidatus Gagatemarchaeaceae archaeon]
MAQPDVQIEVGDDTVDVHAEEVKGRERDTLYGRQAALYPQFAEYQRGTKRIIPVISLTGRKK